MLKVAVFASDREPFTQNGKQEYWSSITCTLLYTEKECLLVDTPISISQNEKLISWIKEIAPDRLLRTIFITHGHPDHWFGLPMIFAAFPEAKAYGTAGTVAHMHESVTPEQMEKTWGAWFGARIPEPYTFAEPVPNHFLFRIDETWECEVIEVGTTDTHDTSILWVPSLKLVVAGDVIYGQYHQMLALSSTAEKRQEWLKAIDMVEDLDPLLVVAGHRQAEEIPGRWCIEATRQYIKDFDRLVVQASSSGGGAAQVIEEMSKLHKDRLNPWVLHLSAQLSIANA